jgi:hypothetical protein
LPQDQSIAQLPPALARRGLSHSRASFKIDKSTAFRPPSIVFPGLLSVLLFWAFECLRPVMPRTVVNHITRVAAPDEAQKAVLLAEGQTRGRADEDTDLVQY